MCVCVDTVKQRQIGAKSHQTTCIVAVGMLVQPVYWMMSSIWMRNGSVETNAKSYNQCGDRCLCIVEWHATHTSTSQPATSHTLYTIDSYKEAEQFVLLTWKCTREKRTCLVCKWWSSGIVSLRTCNSCLFSLSLSGSVCRVCYSRGEDCARLNVQQVSSVSSQRDCRTTGISVIDIWE